MPLKVPAIGAWFVLGWLGSTQAVRLPGWLLACSTEELPNLPQSGISLLSAPQRPATMLCALLSPAWQAADLTEQWGAPHGTAAAHSTREHADTSCENASLIMVATLAKIFWEW